MTKQAPSEQDNYDVREQIGRGAFGNAFLVMHRDTKKLFVLKKIRLARQTDWQRKSSFQEMQVTMALEHPYVVPHVESWVDRGHTINIVYGYCERGDLSTLLNRYRQRKQHIPESNLKLWLCQCLMALEHCHARAVLHRDIKSGNIFLTAEGNVMVGDFGLATVRGSDDDDHSLVGTPHYMSPELLSKKPYSFKSDIFSLGVVLYELTAQRPPFTAFNIHGLIHKIKRAPMPGLPSTYSSEWCNVIRNMLRKQPDSRPSATELLNCSELRDAYIEARRRAKLISPSIQLPDIVEGGALPTVPERTASAKGLSHALSVGRAPRASPLPDNDAPADADAHDERRGPKEAARERAGAIPSAAAIRQRSRARAQGPAGHHWGSPGPVGEFDGSVAQVIPRAELGGGEEEEEGAARTDYEGAADGSDDGEGNPRGPPRPAEAPEDGRADSHSRASATSRRGHRRSSTAKGSKTSSKGSSRKALSASKQPAVARPIVSSWSPRNADAARRMHAAALPATQDDPAPRTPAPPIPKPRAPGQSQAQTPHGNPYETPAGAKLTSFPISPTPLQTGIRHAFADSPTDPAPEGPPSEHPPVGSAGAQARTESNDGSAAVACQSPGGGESAESAESSENDGRRAAGDGAEKEQDHEQDVLRTAHQSSDDIGREMRAGWEQGEEEGEEELGVGALLDGEEGEYRSEDDEDYEPRSGEEESEHDSDYEDLEDEDYGYSEGAESLIAELDETRAELAQAREVLGLATRLFDAGRLEELGYMLHAATGRPDPEGVEATAPGSRLQHLHQARKACPFQLGDQVIVGNRRRMRAVIRYFGPTAFGQGDFVGMELEHPDGKNNGTVSGVPYFPCAPGCGLFVQSHILRPEDAGPGGVPTAGTPDGSNST